MFRFSLTPSSQQLLFLLCSRALSVAVTTAVTRRCHLAVVFQTQRPVRADGKLLKMFKNRFRSRILRPTPEDSQNSHSGARSCKRPGLPAPPLGTFVKASERRVNWEGLMGRSVPTPTAVALLLPFHTVINDSRSLAAASARTTGAAPSLDECTVKIPAGNRRRTASTIPAVVC